MGRVGGCVVCSCDAFGAAGAAGLGVVGLLDPAAGTDEALACPAGREEVADFATAAVGVIGALGAGTGAFPLTLEAGVLDRPSPGLATWRGGGVLVTGEGKPRPPELNSSITSHFSSLTTISGLSNGRCRRILTSTFPPVALRVDGSVSYE